jgi:cytochrome c oxidase subunit 2
MKKKYLVQGLGLFLLTAFGLPGAWTASSQDVSPQRVEIVAKRFSFSPDEITLKKGVPVTLMIKSEDVTHGIKFKELNLESEIKKDSAKEISFTPEVAGDFVSHCTNFCGEGHGSMMLTIHVTE